MSFPLQIGSSEYARPASGPGLVAVQVVRRFAGTVAERASVSPSSNRDPNHRLLEPGAVLKVTAERASELCDGPVAFAIRIE